MERNKKPQIGKNHVLEQTANLSMESLQNLVALTDRLDTESPQMVDLLLQICNMNSGTLNRAGIEGVAERLEHEFNELGGVINRLDVADLIEIDNRGEETKQRLGPLLHIVKRPTVRPRILLCIHMDTVYSPDHPFQSCRWNADGTLNGPGVADAKGGIVVMLHALKCLEQSPFADRVGWEVILNPDEELGSPGSEAFLLQRASQANFGLLFEPKMLNGTLVSWRKGVGNFVFVVRGRSAHAGRDFESGRNAVVACCQLMERVHQLNVDPEVTFNVGRVNGGGPLNVVPELAIGRVNVRVKTTQQMNRVEQQLSSLARTFGERDGYSVQCVGRFTSPPKEVTAEMAELQLRVELCGQVLNQTIAWQGTGGASDGNKFAAAGLANVDSLGPIGGNIHSSEEFVVSASLVPAAKLAALILLSFSR